MTRQMGIAIGAALLAAWSTLDASPPASAPQGPDPAGRLQSRYLAAGSPRVVLFWNTELTDRGQVAQVDRQTESARSSTSRTMNDESTAGAGGTARILEDDERRSEERQTVRSREYREEPKRKTNLGAREMSVLQRTFASEMQRAGLTFVDRTLAVRRTAAERHRGGADPNLVETDAIVGTADLLMQVLMIPDAGAPLKWGFDVSVRDVARGNEIVSFYSAAMPERRQHARWVASDRGFEREIVVEPLTVEAVATVLARESMERLAAALPASAPRRPR